MTSPFKFLDAYEATDFSRYFGRDRETAQLYNALYASNLTVLYGASGTGKTSLVRCGLVGRFLDSDWLPVFIRREEDINASFKRAIREQWKESTRKQLSDQEHYTIEEQLSLLYFDYYRPVYLVFDQFEELYLLAKQGERFQFYQTVSKILDAAVQAKVLIIIREEYFGFLNEFEKVVPTIYDNRLRLEKMNDRNLSRVIYSTLQYESIQIEDPRVTITAILNNLRQKNQQIELTDLQVYLDRLYREAESQRSAPDFPLIYSPHLVQSLGRMENVLADFLDEQIEQIERELATEGLDKRGLPMELLLLLITEEGTKSAETIEQLRRTISDKRGVPPEYIDYCIRRFFEMRILKRKL